MPHLHTLLALIIVGYVIGWLLHIVIEYTVKSDYIFKQA